MGVGFDPPDGVGVEVGGDVGLCVGGVGVGVGVIKGKEFELM